MIGMTRKSPDDDLYHILIRCSFYDLYKIIGTDQCISSGQKDADGSNG
jgi:hypothetical protein